MLLSKELREQLRSATVIPKCVIEQVYEERLLQIWVPKIYGGLGLRLNEGLEALFSIAKVDGSLGWMLTLCSGANFFSRNLKPDIAKQLFSDSKTCFGGSGMIGGTAEKQQDGSFLINGLWDFATGAPHLSHFTLNARISENGKFLCDESGAEKIRSFVVSKDEVKIIPNWKSMGMKATGTYSFEVKDVQVAEDYSFIYDEFFTNDAIDRIPFKIFADLTLFVNYLGMASQFAEEAVKIRSALNLDIFKDKIDKGLQKVMQYAEETEYALSQNESVSIEKQKEIHDFSTGFVESLSQEFLRIYFQLGIRASQTDSAAHQIFCDYFTATQHGNFRKQTI